MAQSPAGEQSVVVHPRGLHWSQYCSTSSSTAWKMGQSAPSACLQMIQNWKEWLMHQVHALPVRGTWTGSRIGQNRTSWSPTKAKRKVLHLGRNKPSTHWRSAHTVGEQLCRERPGVLVNKKSNWSQQCGLAHWPTASWAVWGKVLPAGNPSPLLSTGETPGELCPVLNSPLQERHGHTEATSEKGHKDD